jgi:hypothetical protein
LSEGKNVNLRIMQKDDLPMFAEWANKPEVRLDLILAQLGIKVDKILKK